MEFTGLTPGFKLAPAIILLAVLVSFIWVGWTSKVQEMDGYWVAGRTIGPVQNGMAIASNWMSAASFMGVPGMLYMQGFFGVGYVVGWTGGYVLLLLLFAGQIRRFGKYTAPDFVGDRFYSNWARGLAAVITLILSTLYITGQYKGMGMIFGWIFGWPYEISVVISTILVLFYVFISGMLGVTKNQVVQYIVLIAAFLFPLFFIASQMGYFPLIPQISYGSAAYTAMELDPKFALP